jgi:hypothetical protein
VDEWEVLKSAEAIFQAFESSGGRASYRTALVLRQDSERPIEVAGERPTYGLFLIEVGRPGAQPNSLELRAHADLASAKSEAIQWVGAERVVQPDQVPPTALIGVANVIRDPTVLQGYRPR